MLQSERRLRRLDWVNIMERAPEPNQHCLTKLNVSFIEGRYNADVQHFEAEYFQTILWKPTHWVPIEDAMDG